MSEYEFITWSDRYSTGYSRIDEEHKILVNILNNLHRDVIKCEKGKEHVAFKNTIKDLENYVSFHFSHEERLMNRFNYPRQDIHKIRHNEFIAKISEKAELYKEDPKLVTSQFLIYLRDWILEHIAIEDKNMMLYIFNYLRNNRYSNNL